MSDNRTAAVLAADDQRCRALVEQDFSTLRTVISKDLTHTHTGGNTEDFDQYFALLKGPMRYLSIERRGTNVRFYGPIAVMTGNALTSGRLGDGDPITLETTTLQVWAETTEGWQMVAYQGTRIT